MNIRTTCFCFCDKIDEWKLKREIIKKQNPIIGAIGILVTHIVISWLDMEVIHELRGELSPVHVHNYGLTVSYHLHH